MARDIAVRGLEVCEGHAPRLAKRRGTTRQRHCLETTDALESRQIGNEELAAPQAPVGPIAKPIKGHTDDTFIETVLDQARRHVGVMMLHRDRRQIERGGERGGQVAGVKIMHHHFGCDSEQRQERVDHFVERLKGRHVLQIAEMRRKERLSSARDAHRVLQPGADGQYARSSRCQPDRPGRKATGPAYEHGATVRDSEHRVVCSAKYGPIVGEERIGDGPEPGVGIVIVDRDRFLGSIAAGEHERRRKGVGQQLMEWAWREKNTDDRRRRSNRFADKRLGSLGDKHNRALRRRKSALLIAVDVSDDRGRVEVAHHHGERLLIASLTSA